MKTETVDVLRLFNQAWSELYCPPVKLSIIEKKKKSDYEAKFAVVDGTVYLKPDIVPRGADPEKYLLCIFVIN